MTRTIQIPVELPQVHVVHTVELELPQHGTGRLESIPTALVGQVLPAELRIQHTRVWDDREAAVKGRPYEFVYEIHCDMDHWLIGGQKRVAFSAKVGDDRP
jgi:hypothetical protein